MKFHLWLRVVAITCAVFRGCATQMLTAESCWRTNDRMSIVDHSSQSC